MSFMNKIKQIVNIFTNKKEEPGRYIALGSSTAYPDRVFYTGSNDRSIITSIYNRIAIDVAAIKIAHVKVDDQERFKEQINSITNQRFNLSANIDQTGRAFTQDLIETMFNEGYAAILPTLSDRDNPDDPDHRSIHAMRVGSITQWFPDKVEIEAYNKDTGLKERIIVDKKDVAIVENPFFTIMNTPNGILRRVVTKLNIQDVVDKQLGSNRLDLIIQLPYIIKSQTRRDEADKRRKEIEEQLANSRYGVAYTDGTEKITQLNRPVESNLLPTIQYLMSMLHSQLGITEKVLNGSASPDEMLNYMNRTVEPICAAVVNEINRKFLTETERANGERFMFFNSPFKLIPVEKLADIADKFTRNEILSSNEVRQIVGMKPSDDPRADELINKNMPVQDQEPAKAPIDSNKNLKKEKNQNGQKSL